MGLPRNPHSVLFFTGMLFTDEGIYDAALTKLEDFFGEAVMESAPVRWDCSAYYREEMGEPIFRRFIFFKNLKFPDSLAASKLFTNGIEASFSVDGRRKINIDPGYMHPAKIVLASTKDYSHRIYLRDGIYAEVTLLFQKGRFESHVNTYREFQEERNLKTFYMARRLYFLLREGQKQTISPS
ncbi:MAG: DUF4416 family protein [Nitrospirae bacterium]|nr:MAG: DUF4416 family protein [Nitrospirota bacterium]